MSTSSISPTERQRLRELQARLDRIATDAVAGCQVSVEDTACGAASVAIGRLLEALEASEREAARRAECRCIYEVGSGEAIDATGCEMHADTAADAELAEDRADFFTRTEEPR